MKTPRQLERHLKGAANHWRISILFLVLARDGITVDEITESLKGNIKTISSHTQKLTQAGLLEKRYAGTAVKHTLSPYGKILIRFLKTF